jgi:zinc protease
MSKLKFLTGILLFCVLTNLVAQDLSKEIPIDPSISIGKLDNGLTYYIKHNPKTENKAELRLVIDAGSVLETEKQQGLAHFLEHMAFNGTRNFKKNELIDYLENLGVLFGADLNAHTSFDETVYKLTLPTDDDEVYDKGIEILRDWSDGMTLAEKDIDEERGVIAEELRSGLIGSRRLFNSYVPLITNNARHAKRLPIGKLNVILNADYEELRKFYRDWYRPDLMALMVVGDIDVEETKQKILQNFGDLKNPPNPKQRTHYGIPDNEELKAGIFTDPEVSSLKFFAYYKKQKNNTETLGDYRTALINRLYTGMLNLRLEEAREEGVAPVIEIKGGIGDFLADKDSYFVSATLKEDHIKEGIIATLKESERAKRYGFKQSELDRYKKQLLNSANLIRKEEGKINSRAYVEDYIEHFIEHKPIPGSEFTYEFYKTQLPTITLEEINAVSEEWIGDENISLVLAGPEKEDLELPKEETLVHWFESIKDLKLEAYEDDLKVDELMSWTPKSGKVKSSSYNKEINVTEWKLSNGVTVVLKPTKLQNDVINLSGVRPGGSSLAPDKDYISARFAGDIINQSGLNNISESGLRKLNMGKTASVKSYINFYEELISGESSTRDFETMLKMTHLSFTSPNKDEAAFSVFKDRRVSAYKNNELNPYSYFRKKIAVKMTDNHLRATPVESKQVKEELDLDKAYDFYKKRFASAKGFTFFIVGNFELDSIKPYVETYLASLPSGNIKQKSKDIKLRYTQGNNETFYKGQEDKAEVHLRYTGKFDFSIRKKDLLSALSHVIRLRLYEELRENRGGVYGVRVASYASEIPYNWYRHSIDFTTSPDDVEELIKAVHSELDKIRKEGVTEADLHKVKEALRLRGKEGLDYNSYWSMKLKEVYRYDLDPSSIPDFNCFADELNSNELQELAKEYLTEANYSQFVLLPENIAK